jgi:hypothetical protein
MRLQVVILPQESRGRGYVVPYLLVLDEVGDEPLDVVPDDLAAHAGARAVLVFTRRVTVVPPWGYDDDGGDDGPAVVVDGRDEAGMREAADRVVDLHGGGRGSGNRPRR